MGGLAATAVMSVLVCCGVASAPAVAADVRVALPQVPIDADTTSFTVSGTAPLAPPGGSGAYLVVVPRAGSSCAAPGPATALQSQPLFVPSVGQVLAVGSLPVSGAFSQTYELAGVMGTGVVCAWLLTQDTPAGLLLGATATGPIRLLYRLPVPGRGAPFFVQTPRVRGGVLTAYLGRDRDFIRFMATCEQRGSHEAQRFTLSRSVRPDPATGAFKATGIAKADNSRNYDAPIPAPYRGRAMLSVSGRIIPAQQGIRIRGTMTLGGPGLSCLRTTLRE